MVTPDRGLRRARRHGDRRPRQPRRLHRLALPAPLRLARLLRRPARHPRERPLAHRAGGARRARPAATSTTRSCSRPSTRPTTGAVRVTDLMPLGDGRADLIRRVEGVRGHRPDAPRVGRAVRLRHGSGPWVSRAPGHEQRHRGHHRGRRPRHARAARHPAPQRRGRAPRATSSTCRRARSYTFSTTWFPSYKAIPPPLDVDARIDETIAPRNAWAGRCDYTGPYREQVLRSLLTLRLHDPLAHRRHRRRPHDQPARGLRRRAQLGLPLLLAARRLAHARGAARLRLRRGDTAVAQLAAARRRRRPGGPADHVPRRRRPRPARARTCDHLPGYAGSPAGAHRQRRGRPAPDRRARRGDDRAREGAQRAAWRETPSRGRCSAPWSTTSPRTGTSPTTGCGRSAARCGTSPTPASWCGRPSTAPSPGSSSTASRARSSGGASCGRRCASEVLDKGFDAGAEHLHPALRHRRGRRLPAAHPHRGVPAAERPAGARHHRRRRGGPACATGFLLRYRTETGVDGLAGDEHPFLACSWWLVSAYAMCGHGGQGARADGPPRRRCSTTSGWSPRSTTRRTGAWSATSPRPSRT